MSRLPRIDVHTHAFHEKIAAKVVKQLENYYKIPPIGTGEFRDLEPRLKKADIDYVCIHSAATTPKQVVPANRWAISLKKHPGVFPFGTMHPQYDKMEEELAYLYDHGIRGIKLHPDFQGFWLDDPALLPLFGAMEGRFTLMVHIGDNKPPKENPSCPWKLAAIIRKFPKLQVIAAHFGGFRHWQYVVEAMKGLDFYMDTSSSLFEIPQELLEGIYKTFPHDHFLFGSDYPLFDPGSEMIRLQERLHLSDHELEAIMTNANQLGFFNA
ncbi:MAG: amidohydrolase family protein [Lentisphaeria bacterium]